MATLISYVPDGTLHRTNYPSLLVAAPMEVLLKKTFAYDIGSPFESSRTNPFMLTYFWHKIEAFPRIKIRIRFRFIFCIFKILIKVMDTF